MSQDGIWSTKSSPQRFSGVARREGVPTIADRIRVPSSPAGTLAMHSIE